MSLSLSDIGSIIAIIGLVVAVLKLYLEQRKAKKDLELAKEYLHTLSELVKSYKIGVQSLQQLEKEKLQWDTLKSFGKALGWVIEHSEEE
jgi:Co/Zn/Cd efflux system component